MIKVFEAFLDGERIFYLCCLCNKEIPEGQIGTHLDFHHKDNLRAEILNLKENSSKVKMNNG